MRRIRFCKTCGILVPKGKSYCTACMKQRIAAYTKRVYLCACSECKQEFSSTNRKAQFCSFSCKSIYCANRQGKATLKYSPIRSCEVCGKHFKRRKRERDSARCCSWECGQVLTRQRITEQANASEARRTIAKFRRLYERLRQCDVCKLAFVARQSDQRLCGDDECRKEGARRASLECYRRAEKPCLSCGVIVQPEQRAKRLFRPQYCEACRLEGKRASKRRAKARERIARPITGKHQSRAVVLALRQLIERAGSRCPLCGLLMTRQVDPSHSRALEIDHYIPLAKGGTDTLGNVRAICRKCNGFKSDFMPLEFCLPVHSDL
jgi:hypothetical protein